MSVKPDVKLPDLRYVSPAASDAAGQVASPAAYPTTLYPAIDRTPPASSTSGGGHQLAYDVSGNPEGVPCLFLHGGPGAGASPRCRQFFDPVLPGSSASTSAG